MSVGSAYEIRCGNCQVSFPPGTKKCIHCGGRLGGRPGSRTASRPPTLPPTVRAPQGEDFFPTAFEGDPAAFEGLRPEAAEEPGASTPRRAIRVGVNLLWIVGAVLLTALQMCRGGA